MTDLALAAVALAACCVLLWLRITGLVQQVQWRAFRGVVHAAGGLGPLTLDAISGRLRPCVGRFHLRAPGIDLGEIALNDSGLGIVAGHTATAIYAERVGHAPQPMLVFNHETRRWRTLTDMRAALRGDTVSHYLPLLVFFTLICLLWSVVSASAPVFHIDFEFPMTFEAEPLVLGLVAVGIALAALSFVAALAVRRLDAELERRAVASLRDALFLLAENEGTRRAQVNLAMPRTRRMPNGDGLIAL